MPDIARRLDGRTLVLLSNREPYERAAAPAGVGVRRRAP
jgi:hypothetical protein